MKINRLEHTKSLYPHFFDKTDDSNFTKHLKVVGKPQQHIRHKLKTIDWSRILEKPLQIWKEQSEPYVYDMHFKSLVPYLKEFNVYRNPVIGDDEEILRYDERVVHETFKHEDYVRYYERTVEGVETTEYIHHYDSNDDPVYHQRIIPNDTYVLEIITWDDYRFIKGFPENDYTVKEDNVLQYRYNETFLSIKLEEISYRKYLTFRVHKDNIKEIIVRKNEKPIFKQEFIIDIITNKPSTDFSYTYFDNDISNEYTYNAIEYAMHTEIEDEYANNIKAYFAEQENDEYVFRLPLTDDDFESGVIKDIYDLEVILYEKRYHCLHEYDRMYSKRYNGYDSQLNDCFDHDYSLDIIGALMNIPRLRFYQVYRNNNYYLSRTYPAYNNRSTEDDYHYMKRMQYYISNYNHIAFPILEFWKWYQTDATIRSRRHILAEMDYTHFRTEQSIDDVCGTDFVDDEFDEEPIATYSINKATRLEGEVTLEHAIVRGNHTWYESVIVNKVYVVPDARYRVRYGIADNNDDINLRMICYNRDGMVLRTKVVGAEPYVVEDNTVEEEHGYSDDSSYDFTDTSIVIPSDTVSIQLVLESDSTFNFKHVTFERITVANFDNSYIVTDTDYNSNVYELYAVYEDIPTNIRIGGSERFSILFNRSLPLTKRGYTYMSINQGATTTLMAETSLSLQVSNILDENHRSGDEDYEVMVEDFVGDLMHYSLWFTVENEDIVDYDYSENLTTTTLTYYDQYDNEVYEQLDDRIYTDSPTRIMYRFIVPEGTVKFKINISNANSSTLSDIMLMREEELLDEEVYYND